jgi:hypothetical protein
MWGFGMRMAVWSGTLAAKDILGECDYESEVRKKLMPYVKTSVVNRWLMNRVGNRTFKFMCNNWMRSQKRHGDGLVWVSNLFRPSLFKRMLYPIVSPFMLKSDPKAMGRGVRRMPFRPALKRDWWEQSPEAKAVGERWDNVRRSGANTSFSNDAESSINNE